MKPKTKKSCTGCGICAKKCPVGAIPPDRPSETDVKKCISCMRCVSICPQKSRGVSKALLAAGSMKLKNPAAGEKKMNCFSDVKKTGQNTSESRWMFRLRKFILSLERGGRLESNDSIFERRNFMNPGNHLFDARKKYGLSQEDVAKKLGVSRRFPNGRRTRRFRIFGGQSRFSLAFLDTPIVK